MPGQYDSSLTRVQPFFELALADGGDWLAKLLAASPRGREALGAAVDTPGTILATMVAPHPQGKAPRACYEYEVLPGRRFLRWCVLHPDVLSWPQGKTYGPSTTKSRRALLYDEPPGRTVAQQQAIEQIELASPATNAWWRFEGSSWIDCVLATARVVITVEGKRTEPLSSSTHWYRQRSQLVRNLEAARDLARGRVWGTLLLSERKLPEGEPDAVAATLDEAAPHLDEAERAALQHAYLGNLTWEEACAAIGVPFAALPTTVP